jgi:hypothetical protein
MMRFWKRKSTSAGDEWVEQPWDYAEQPVVPKHQDVFAEIIQRLERIEQLLNKQ